MVLLLAALLVTATTGCTLPTDEDGADVSDSDHPVGTEYGGVDFVLNVITNPPGAEVWLNGAALGTTPVLGAPVGGQNLNRVIIRAGGTEWERIITPRQSTLPNRCIYIDATIENGPQNFERRTIRSEPEGALVYLGGIEVGRTPLALDRISSRQAFYMVVYAEGYLPQRHRIEPWFTGSDHFVALDAPSEGMAGPVEASMSPPPPAMAWDGPSSGHVKPDGTCFPGPRALLSPTGQLALITGAGPVQSIVVYDLPSRQKTGRTLVSWRTGHIVDAQNEDFFGSLDLYLLGWQGERVLFLAPEPEPGGTPGQMGLGLWGARVDGDVLDRIAWVPEWGLGRVLETAWLTADGQAAVIQTVDLGPDSPGRNSCNFHVIDLDTREQAVYSADLPGHESALHTMVERSLDGWQLAYAMGQVKWLDLRTGETRVLPEGTRAAHVETLSLSPDGLYLAIGTGTEDNPGFELVEDEGTIFFPGSFLIVSTEGTRVAEVVIPGSALGPNLQWDPEGGRVAVRVVQKDESSRDVLLGPVYAGPLTGPWTEVDDNGVYPYSTGSRRNWFGFTADGKLVVARDDAEGVARTVLITLDTGESSVAQGYVPVVVCGPSLRPKPVALPQGVLLARARTSAADLAPMALFKPDGPLVPLKAAGSFRSCEGPFVLLHLGDGSIQIVALDTDEGAAFWERQSLSLDCVLSSARRAACCCSSAPAPPPCLSAASERRR